MGWAPAKWLVSLDNFAANKLSPQSGRPNIGRVKCMLMRQSDYFMSKIHLLAKFPAPLFLHRKSKRDEGVP
ncbi:hypothetical protein ACVIIW_002727 [Bradyrhizobium sp. USDA 4449]